jgi:hypothetical protein
MRASWCSVKLKRSLGWRGYWPRGALWNRTLAVDKGFDAQDFVAELREINVTPNAAQHSNGRRTVVNGRTKRLDGYAISLRVRKRIEEAFGLAKTVTGMRNPRHGGLPKVDW